MVGSVAKEEVKALSQSSSALGLYIVSGVTLNSTPFGRFAVPGNVGKSGVQGGDLKDVSRKKRSRYVYCHLLADIFYQAVGKWNGFITANNGKSNQKENVKSHKRHSILIHLLR